MGELYSFHASSSVEQQPSQPAHECGTPHIDFGQVAYA
jgi:hypothetical protein